MISYIFIYLGVISFQIIKKNLTNLNKIKINFNKIFLILYIKKKISDI